jgi:hypothetical protein
MSEHHNQKQVCHSIKAKTGLFKVTILLGFALMTLTACGKRPGYVDPPPEVEEDHFPNVYPDPSTDPKP